MEPLRPIVDRDVLQLVHRHKFKPADFTLTTKGYAG
jgi:CRISPR/Cas system-associated endonuclease Cas1